MIVGKYEGRVVICYDLEGFYPHIAFLPNQHKYWFEALENHLEKKGGENYEFHLDDGFLIKLKDLKLIFNKISLLRKMLKCQIAEL